MPKLHTSRTSHESGESVTIVMSPRGFGTAAVVYDDPAEALADAAAFAEIALAAVRATARRAATT